MATLVNFLTLGHLGDIRLGMSRQMVQEHLGPPDDRSIKRSPLEIWKYGSIEFTFKRVPDTDDARLVSNAVYFFNPDRKLPSALRFNDWMPTATTTEAEVCRYLETAGLPVHRRQDEESAQLLLDSGASIIFDDDVVHSLHYHRAEKASARRQLSISLPDSALTELRDRARRENVTLQQLVERVLTEK